MTSNKSDYQEKLKKAIKELFSQAKNGCYRKICFNKYCKNSPNFSISLKNLNDKELVSECIKTVQSCDKLETLQIGRAHV